MNFSHYALHNINITKIFASSLRRFADSATYDTMPYNLHKLNDRPSSKITITRDEGLRYFRDMIGIRKMEAEAQRLYRKKLIRGFCHLYIGEEACCVGIHAAMKPVDTITGSYRIHGWTYVLTKNVKCVLNELTGNKHGVSRGKGGSMHMYYDSLYGGQGIVGAQVPQGVGVAFTHQYLKNGGVSITIYGDGAANQGQLFEAFNMAKLWEAPCLFLCENNRYAMGTSVKRGAAGGGEYYKRVDFVPGIQSDGMDVLSVVQAAKFALEYCRSGNGPLVLELVTYRFLGHSMSDPDTTYRTRDEVKQERQIRDPIKRLKKQMLKAELATEEDFKKIEDNIMKEVKEGVNLAISPDPLPVADMVYDIHANNIEKDIRGVNPWITWKTSNRPVEELPCPPAKSENVKK